MDKRFRLGGSLGAEHKNWFRDKFGSGRFRLFFRFDSKSKVIILTWVNDENTKRTYGSKSDAYAIFASMLNNGNPPSDWASLKAACKGSSIADRLEKVLARVKKAKE
jgi:toxin YhaV